MAPASSRRISGLKRSTLCECLFPLVVAVTFGLIHGQNHGFRHDLPRSGCIWSNSNSSGSPTPTFALDCSLRTLNPEFWNYTFTREQKLGTRTVSIKCSDKLYFESFLTPNSSLFQLDNLETLNIHSCKIRKIPRSGTGAGVWARTLKSLILHSHNGDWPSSIGLEIESRDFEGLDSLENLDLSFNNVWVVPEDRFLCSLPNLGSLNLSHNSLSEVPEELGGCENPGQRLETLDLSFNTIRRISRNGFSRSTKLTQIFLQNNYIEEIEDLALANLGELRVLNLSQNRLVAIPPRLFKHSQNLQEIHISNNSLSALSQEVFSGLQQLVVLDLSRNSLSSQWVQMHTFKSLASLTTLRLSFNQLSHLDEFIFRDLISLQNLALDNNRIEDVASEAFAALTNLQVLDLSRNRLSVIETRLFSCGFVLRSLYLDHNRIRRMDEDALQNCTNLQDLGLAGNILPEIPASVGSGKLGALRTLDLGENRILEVKRDSFAGLGQLYGLRLVDNRISNLPPGLCEPLTSLRVMNLAQNRVNSIAAGAFAGCEQLRALRLDTNEIQIIPPNLPPALLWLNVSGNRLRVADFESIPNSIEWLDLSHNALEILGGQRSDGNLNFVRERDRGNERMLRRSGVTLAMATQGPIRVPQIQKSHLRVLDVSHNRLRVIDSSGIPPLLENLRLNHNELTQVAPDTFLRATKLRRVELIGNKLEALEQHALRFPPIPMDRPIPSVYLAGNPFICDCALEWLTRVNQNPSGSRQYPRIMDLEAVTCRSHSQLNSTSDARQIQKSDFLCPYTSHCSPDCLCCDFEACDCAMTCPEDCTCLRDSQWTVNVVMCSDLNFTTIPNRLPMDATEIRLDGNRIPMLGSHLFIGKRNLRMLALNGSQVQVVRNRTFHGLQGSLEELHLENNELEVLQGFEFQGLRKLKYLHLHGNRLNFIVATSFDGLEALQVLTLHGNELREINVLTWPWSGNSALMTLTVALNPFSCACEFIVPFRTWAATRADIVKDLDSVNCMVESTAGNFDSRIPISSVCKAEASADEAYLENNQIQISRRGGAMASDTFASAAAGLNDDDESESAGMEDLLAGNVNLAKIDEDESVYPITWAILASVGALVIVGGSVLAFILFRREIQFRGKSATLAGNFRRILDLRGLCCSAGGKKGGTTQIPPVHPQDPDSDKLFDAYFLYSRRDEEILTRKIAPELEHDRGQGEGSLRLCLHYRDLFISPAAASPWNPEMVAGATESSKRLVLVLSRSFLQCEWTNEDFRRGFSAALSTRGVAKKLIIILLPPLSPTSLQHSAYAYPELRLAASSAAAVLSWTEEHFWTKFKRLLPAPSNYSVNSISRNCTVCGTLPSARNLSPPANLNSNSPAPAPYTNLDFSNSHWPYPPNMIRQPQTFVTLLTPLPPIQFTAGHGHGHSHPNYHRQENSMASTISRTMTYRPLTDRNLSDSTDTIRSSSNEELDHIYSTLDSPIQSPGSGVGSPKIHHQRSGAGGSCSSGIGSGGGDLTSPSSTEGGSGGRSHGEMYFV